MLMKLRQVRTAKAWTQDEGRRPGEAGKWGEASLGERTDEPGWHFWKTLLLPG